MIFFLAALDVLNWISKIDTTIAEKQRYFID
jgi:hypothetical protein